MAGVATVSGLQICEPYGIDGMSGSFWGVYDPKAIVVHAQLEYLAGKGRKGPERAGKPRAGTTA